MVISYQVLLHRTQQQMFFLLVVSIFLTICTVQAQAGGSYTICRQEEDIISKYDVCYDVVDFNTITTYYLENADTVTSRLSISESDTLVMTKKDFQNPVFDKVDKLYLDYNFISVFNPEPLTGLKNLYKLVLKSNFIDTIYNNSFSGLNLTTLHIDHNAISNINEGAFSSQVNLVNLTMSENRITQLPAAVFQGLTSLQLLEIDGNYLSSIDDNLFRGLVNLIVLNLSHNRISSIGPNAFKSLSKLTTLHLTGNQLKVIDIDVFSGNAQLKYLDLSYNKLLDLDKVVLNVSSLLEVGLVGTNIKSIPRDFFQLLPSLDGINLSNNELDTSTDVFDSMPVLREVYVGGSVNSAVPLKGFRAEDWKEGDYPRYNILVGPDFNCNITEFPRLNPEFVQKVSSNEKVITCLKVRVPRRRIL